MIPFIFVFCNGNLDQKFFDAKKGRSSCSGSFGVEDIMNLEDCKLAGIALRDFVDGYEYNNGMDGFRQSENSDSTPKGCYSKVLKTKDGVIIGWFVNWNSHNIGGSWVGEDDASPVCKRSNIAFEGNDYKHV